MTRTFDPLQTGDLQEIRAYALDELERFLYQAGNPPGKFAHYQDRLIAICLCQGAAQHFVDLLPEDAFDTEIEVSHERIGKKGLRVRPDDQVISGVKDIDVCLFFGHDDRTPIPVRNHCIKTVPATFQRLGHRDVDFLKKGVGCHGVQHATQRTPQEIVKSYLQHTDHGKNYLSKKSVVGLCPDTIFALPLWRTRRLTRR
jgi:hypothetical protein